MFYTSKALHTPIELYKYLLQNEFVLLLWNPAMPPGSHKYPRRYQSEAILTRGLLWQFCWCRCPKLHDKCDCAREGRKVHWILDWFGIFGLVLFFQNCSLSWYALWGRCWKPGKLGHSASISHLGSISTLVLRFPGLPRGRRGSHPTRIVSWFYPCSEMSPAVGDLIH